MRKALRMSEEHRADGEGTQTELVADKELGGATRGTATMTKAELGGNEEDVRIALGFRQLRPKLDRASRPTELLFDDLPLAPVVKVAVPRLLERVKDLLDGLGIGRPEDFGIRHPVRDGKPTLSTFRK